MLDLGYLGGEKDLPEQLYALPYKKKRNQEDLSQEEKKYNRIHSKKKEDSDRAYHHMSIEKVQNSE